MSDNRFASNQPSVLTGSDNIKNIQIGVVASIEDPDGLGRIKVSISGPSEIGGDLGTPISDLPWCYPMIPKFFTSTPKVGEGVFVFIISKNKTHSDRLYLGPIISQLGNLDDNPVSTVGLTPFTFATLTPKTNISRIPAIKGVFNNPEDIVIQGRYNTDLVFKKNQILLRAGKFIESTPNDNNPYSFEFNTTSQGYIQLINDVQIAKDNDNIIKGSVTNIVANKINLLTHRDGTPRFNLTNQENLISDVELSKILTEAHQLPFGDILIEYLKLLKNAFLNHVHNSNGTPPTDLSIGVLNLKNFKDNAEDLENRMLSINVRIN